MWLIETTTYALTFFSNAGDVPYAILSHTWEDGEVTFQDMAILRSASRKKGWNKIKMTCEIALKDHKLSYAWIDACCIDKSSSAELSEAINSMFSWYQKAAVCIVHLSDYHLRRLDEKPPPVSAGPEKKGKGDLASCRWFARGWTLQELIAPRNMIFYNAVWSMVGSKQRSTSILSNITGIDRMVLEDVAFLDTCHIGTKMSWAAGRSTTRVEDVAYCLLGIFDINMPLLYGEGDKAFLRLQQELAKTKNDLTLFAWRQAANHGPWYRGLFANSPDEFRFSARLKVPPGPMLHDTEFSITNRGLRFENNVVVDRTASRSECDALLLGLDCLEQSDETGGLPRWAAIYLRQRGSSYVRFDPWRFAYEGSRSAWRSESSLVAYVAPKLSIAQAYGLGQSPNPYSTSLELRLKDYFICYHESLRVLTVPRLERRHEFSGLTLAQVQPDLTIASYKSFIDAPSMHIHFFNLGMGLPKPAKVHKLGLLTGCSDPARLTRESSMQQGLWFAIFSVDMMCEHWSRTSGAWKGPSKIDAADAEFRDYIFEHLSDAAGAMNQNYLPEIVQLPNSGHRIRASMTWQRRDGFGLQPVPLFTLNYDGVGRMFVKKSEEVASPEKEKGAVEPGKSPKSPLKSPDRGLDESLEQKSNMNPGKKPKNPDKILEENTGKADKTADKSGDETDETEESSDETDDSSDESPDKGPDKDPNGIPDRTPHKSPDKNGKSPNKDKNLKNPDNSPEKSTDMAAMSADMSVSEADEGSDGSFDGSQERNTERRINNIPNKDPDKKSSDESLDKSSQKSVDKSPAKNISLQVPRLYKTYAEIAGSPDKIPKSPEKVSDKGSDNSPIDSISVPRLYKTYAEMASKSPYKIDKSPNSLGKIPDKSADKSADKSPEKSPIDNMRSPRLSKTMRR